MAVCKSCGWIGCDEHAPKSASIKSEALPTAMPAPFDLPAQRKRLAAIAACAPVHPNDENDPECRLQYVDMRSAEPTWIASIERGRVGVVTGAHPTDPSAAVDAVRDEVRGMLAEQRVKAAERVEQCDEALRKLEGL